MNPPIVATKEWNKNKSSSESDLKSKRKKNIQLIPLNNKHSYNMNAPKHPDIIDDEDIIVPEVEEPKVFSNQTSIKGSNNIQEKKLFNKEKRSINPSKYDDTIVKLQKEDNLTIGQWIKRKRIDLGLSQKELSEKTNISSTFISSIENYEFTPSIDNAIKLCEVLDINLSEFVEQLKREVVTHFLQTIEENILLL
ncbi:MAG: helix-turn-helix domain-containing protein [Candidatus Sericytochromatia bacterium]